MYNYIAPVTFAHNSSTYGHANKEIERKKDREKEEQARRGRGNGEGFEGEWVAGRGGSRTGAMTPYPFFLYIYFF